MKLIDTHCHLNFPEYFPDPDSTVIEAENAGVERLIVIGCDQASSQLACEISARHKGVFAAVGCHPNYSKGWQDGWGAWIRELAGNERAVAIGEIGLDNHWDLAPKTDQRASFMRQLDLAVELGLPAVIHCREAYDELLDLLESRLIPKLILHCFSGDESHLMRGLRLGAYFGFDGPITYKNAQRTREMLASMPKNRVLIETDSPFLTPAPHRGKPNRPAYVALVNAMLASIWEMSPEQSAAITWQNASEAFNL